MCVCVCVLYDEQRWKKELRNDARQYIEMVCFMALLITGANRIYIINVVITSFFHLFLSGFLLRLCPKKIEEERKGMNESQFREWRTNIIRQWKISIIKHPSNQSERSLVEQHRRFICTRIWQECENVNFNTKRHHKRNVRNKAWHIFFR